MRSVWRCVVWLRVKWVPSLTSLLESSCSAAMARQDWIVTSPGPATLLDRVYGSFVYVVLHLRRN
jgi:hypothetical protein